MSTSAIAASITNTAASVMGIERPLTRQPSQYDDSNSGNSVQGSRLFTALFDALTQFVTDNQTAPTASAPGAPSTDPVPAAAPAAPASTAASPLAAASSSGSSGTAASSLGADLQAFLHDLFSALRQAGGERDHGEHGLGRARDDWRWAGAPAAPVSDTEPAATTGATASAASATNSAPTAAAATTSSAAAFNRHGIAAELRALIKDLSNSQVASATSSAAGTPSNLSSSAITNLNAAFSKLIADLGGTASSASTPATASLQSFLSSLLQNLHGTDNSLSPLGNGVNVSA
jgi:hypothetical protein